MPKKNDLSLDDIVELGSDEMQLMLQDPERESNYNELFMDLLAETDLRVRDREAIEKVSQQAIKIASYFIGAYKLSVEEVNS